MQLSELKISSSPAVTAMKREVVALEEEVFNSYLRNSTAS